MIIVLDSKPFVIDTLGPWKQIEHGAMSFFVFLLFQPVMSHCVQFSFASKWMCCTSPRLLCVAPRPFLDISGAISVSRFILHLYGDPVSTVKFDLLVIVLALCLFPGRYLYDIFDVRIVLNSRAQARTAGPRSRDACMWFDWMFLCRSIAVDWTIDASLSVSTPIDCNVSQTGWIQPEIVLVFSKFVLFPVDFNANFASCGSQKITRGCLVDWASVIQGKWDIWIKDQPLTLVVVGSSLSPGSLPDLRNLMRSCTVSIFWDIFVD